jgi:hypothetical protein
MWLLMACVVQDVTYNLLDAGQETTSRLLAALLVILAKDTRVMQKLRDEQKVRGRGHEADEDMWCSEGGQAELGPRAVRWQDVMARHGAALSDASLRDMSYAEAVIKEALRNATPFADRPRGIAVFIVQRALKTFELGGYRIPEARVRGGRGACASASSNQCADGRCPVQGWTVVGNLFQTMQSDPRWKDAEGHLAPNNFYPERWLIPEVCEGACFVRTGG